MLLLLSKTKNHSIYNISFDLTRVFPTNHKSSQVKSYTEKQNSTKIKSSCRSFSNFQVKSEQVKNDLTWLWLKPFLTWLAHLCLNIIKKNYLPWDSNFDANLSLFEMWLCLVLHQTSQSAISPCLQYEKKNRW